MQPTTREETVSDQEAIREIHRAAFGSDEEARLVDALRKEGAFVASLVAEVDGRVVGHILFTELPIQTADGVVRAVALAPMGVAPGFQRRGIGAALVRQGLQLCRARGYAAVVVVGHPEYYPRFGFSAKLAERLRAPFSGPAFMALELVPGALAGIEGAPRYAEAFAVNS